MVSGGPTFRFRGAGARVVVADIDEPAAVKVAKEVNTQTDAKSLSVKVDVSNETSTANDGAVDSRAVWPHRYLG